MAWEALSRGLGNIGALLLDEQERQRLQREREDAVVNRFAEQQAMLAERRAERDADRAFRVGEAEMRRREQKERDVRQEARDVRQDWATRGVNVSPADINAAYGPGTGKVLAGTPQGVAALGERRGAMEALGAAAAASARGRSARTPGGSVAIPNISAVVAGMPPRGGGGTTEPHLTVDQAMDELNRRYAIYDPTSGVLTGYSVPFEQRYEEAMGMARGGPPTPTPPPAPTLFDMGTPLGFPGAPTLRRVPLVAPAAAAAPPVAPRVAPAVPPAVTAPSAPAAPAPRGSAFDIGGAPTVVRPAPTDTAGAGISRTQADSARVGGLIAVSQEEYAGIVADQGEGYARRHYVVTP